MSFEGPAQIIIHLECQISKLTEEKYIRASHVFGQFKQYFSLNFSLKSCKG